MQTKVRFYLMLSFIAIASMAFSQVPPGPGGPGGAPPSKEEMAKMETNRLKEDLKLTDAQVNSVEKISLKYAGVMEEIFENNNGDFAAMQKKMDEMESNKSAEFKKIFTALQYAEYEKQVKERKEKMQQGGPGFH